MVKPAKELKNLIDMKFTNGGEITDMFNYIHNNAKAGEKLWIASPFISSYKIMDYLFDFDYHKRHKTDLRLITDINNASVYNKNILEYFMDNGELRTLNNLHSKIYIMGEHSVITSANMTKKAFFGNYETGVADNKNNNYEKIYEDLWEKAKYVTQKELDSVISKSDKPFEEDEEFGYELIRELPKELTENCNYIKFLNSFEQLSKIYEKSERIWHNSPLKFEIDAFLNYLFHHSKNHRSDSYYTSNEINLNANEDLLLECKNEFREWILSDNAVPYDSENRRLEFEQKAKNLFSKENIKNLTLEQCATFLQDCVNTYLKNGVRFNWPGQFKQKNNINTVISYISELRECKKENVDKLIKHSPVKYMGVSTSQEILGLLRDDLPIRNENTNAGLRYLGYEA